MKEPEKGDPGQDVVEELACPAGRVPVYFVYYVIVCDLIVIVSGISVVVSAGDGGRRLGIVVGAVLQNLPLWV